MFNYQTLCKSYTNCLSILSCHTIIHLLQCMTEKIVNARVLTHRIRYLSLKVSHKVQFWERYFILSFILLHWWTFPSNTDQMNFHFHEDDSQQCISLESCCTNDADRGKTSVEACTRDVDLWMVHDRL